MKGHDHRNDVEKKQAAFVICRLIPSSHGCRCRQHAPRRTLETMPIGRTRFARAAPTAAMSLSLFSLLGCGTAAERAPAPSVPVSEPARPSSEVVAGKEDLNALYNESIVKSATVTPGDGLPLVPLVPGPDGTFTVTTWAKCRGEGTHDRCGSYVAQSSVILKWDVWVTGSNEVRNKCRTWTGDIVLQIQQVLGMPPPQKPMPPETMEQQFVTLSGVPATSVFRPCTDTRLDTDRCAGTTLPPTLPPNAPPDYYRWFTNQAMSSWQIPPKGQTPTGFPWTRLGYTYNWAPGAPSRYGASEYVISGGSKPTAVNVVSVQTAKDFCKPL